MDTKTSILALVAILTQLVSCDSSRNDVVFSVEGKVRNIYPGEAILYRATNLSRKQYDPLDTIEIKSDSSFNVAYDLQPHHYVINFYDSMHVFFVVDSGQHLTIDFPATGGYDVKGSVDNDKFKAYEAFRTSILKKTVYPLRDQLSALQREDKPEDEALREETSRLLLAAEESYRDTLIHQVRKMGTSIAIYPTTLRWQGDSNVGFYGILVDNFSNRYPGLDVTQVLQEKVRLMKQIALGGKVKNVSAQDTTGVKLDLRNSLKTFTLIDFWGSWCAPCRGEAVQLKSLYDRYHDDGFEIYGMAFEVNKKNWMKAIKKDQRVWPNVSDLKGYKTDAALEYSITALPKNFLVDKEGVIVAKDLHGDELAAKLDQLFSQGS